MAKNYLVIGAGVGGLATALRLAHEGHRVTVLEKNGEIGGRNRPATVGACRFDSGPTLMMMLDPFRQLYRDVGERLEDHLEITLCDPSYRVFYRGGERIDGTPNMALMIAQIERMCGREESLAYPRLLGDLADLYRDAIPNFVQKNFRTPADFFGPRQLAMVARHGMLGNLAGRLKRYFKDPRLQMLFSFQTMYLGLSPFHAPWVYSVLTYMEYGEGIWYPKGGLVRIAESIAELAVKRGADIRLNCPVRRVEGNRVELESGETLTADAIFCNADLPYAERELLRQPDKPKRRYSCSAAMMYIDYAGELPDLEHHNVFFGSDFYENLEQIFTRREQPTDPAFYACVSGKTEAAMSAPGHENLMLLVPCANLDRSWTSTEECELREKVFRRLATEVGFDPDRVVGMKTRSPQDWAQELNLERGAAFGLSHDFWQSAFFRPGNRNRPNPNVYFVGASTVPGNGLPMVLISAELAVKRALGI